MRLTLPPPARLAPGLLAGLAACAPGEAGQVAGPGEDAPLNWRGVETRLLDGDLVDFRVAVSGAGANEDKVVQYATCAAAEYTLSRGYGFARHVRTNVSEEDGIWRAGAVYMISPALPQGLRIIDAEVTVADCRDRGIPTV